jgi:transcriptional regulator with XRE-family HTH domain
MENQFIKDNIVSLNTLLGNFNPKLIATALSVRVKQRRLELNLTQKALAAQSGVSLGSLKRFENNAEISLSSLIKLAIALKATEEFNMLFSKRNYTSIEEVSNINKKSVRKRGRKNV